MQGWLRVKDVPGYAGISERTLREWLKQGLRHSRLPSGMILIKREWLDGFLEQYADQTNAVDALVVEILADTGKTKQRRGK